MNLVKEYLKRTKQFPSRNQRRYIKILKEMGLIKDRLEVDKDYNSTTIGIR